MEILQASETHATRISALAITTWVDTYAIEGVRQKIAGYVLQEFSESNIRKKIQESTIFVAIENDHIIAFVDFDESKKQLETLYVLPRFKRQGIGKVLLDHLKNQYGNFRLNCWESNQNAIEFYKANGFTEVGETFFELEDEMHRNIILQN